MHELLIQAVTVRSTVRSYLIEKANCGNLRISDVAVASSHDTDAGASFM